MKLPFEFHYNGQRFELQIFYRTNKVWRSAAWCNHPRTLIDIGSTAWMLPDIGAIRLYDRDPPADAESAYTYLFVNRSHS